MSNLNLIKGLVEKARSLVAVSLAVIAAAVLFFVADSTMAGGKMVAKGVEYNPLAEPPKPDSWAGQLEELIKWVIYTKDLQPRPEECAPPCYVINSLNLSGSVDDNRMRFKLTGGVIADSPVLVPLFGAPHEVMLENVKINGKQAMVGFEGQDYYYIKTAEKSFTLEGELSLKGTLSFTVPGPVNLFTSALMSGKAIEGEKLSGLRYATIHLEAGRALKEEEADERPPIFQLSRAIRIRKEISFEYRVNVRSGREVSSVKLPLKFSEIVLDVPGKKGWKQEGGELLVPTSGKDVTFTVYGRLPKVGEFIPDERSSYEWWLVESDPEHRVIVNTEARQVDSTESPISRQLPSSRLFLVSKGQKLNIAVQPLASIEALAAVVSYQRRMVVWTKDGDVVAEDSLSYDNNGVDYLPFDASGKPIYFEVDGEPQKILSEDESKKNSILIPLRKGKHSVRVQSLGVSESFFFGGIFTPPVPTHGLTISRSSITLGLPSKIIPLWFSGGEGIKSPVGWDDLFFIGAGLIFALILFASARSRIIGFIALAGLYFLAPILFVAILATAAVVATLVLIWRRLVGWRRWLAAGVLAGGILVVVAIISTLLVPIGASMKDADYYAAEETAASGMPPSSPPMVKSARPREEERYAQRNYEPSQVAQQSLGNVLFEGLATIEGVTPVALPLPNYERAVTVERELVTTGRPFTPTLIYLTETALIPILIFWAFCLIYALRELAPRLKALSAYIASLWKVAKEETPI